MRKEQGADNRVESGMKNIILLIGLFAFSCVTLFAQTLPRQELPRLAVVLFTPNPDTESIRQAAITVRNLVQSRMVATGRYEMITRDAIDTLLANQRIQVSDISSMENIRRLQLANINYILTGTVDAMGTDYLITVNILDVSTGRYSHSDSALMGSDSRVLFNGVTGLMEKFTAGMSSEGGRVTQTGQRSGAGVTGAAATYRVGDIGPAGGIIFYDKADFTDGWRYLEAAPAETEFTAQWGAYQHDVPRTGIAVGAGRRNTQLIAERLQQLRENGRAAQLCASLNYNGFNDWFLPSLHELDLIYRNLKQKDIGGFGNSWYWSSTQNNHLYAYDKNFADGRNSFINTKDHPRSIRAVRAF